MYLVYSSLQVQLEDLEEAQIMAPDGVGKTALCKYTGRRHRFSGNRVGLTPQLVTEEFLDRTVFQVSRDKLLIEVKISMLPPLLSDSSILEKISKIQQKAGIKTSFTFKPFAEQGVKWSVASFWVYGKPVGQTKICYLSPQLCPRKIIFP